MRANNYGLHLAGTKPNRLLHLLLLPLLLLRLLLLLGISSSMVSQQEAPPSCMLLQLVIHNLPAKHKHPTRSSTSSITITSG
jgi:hypothetical protein